MSYENVIRKCSLWFAVFARIVMCMPCISRLNELGICSNSSGSPCKKNLHPFKRLGLSIKKICIRSHSSGYLCEKNLHPFEQLGLSVRKKVSSIQKNCHPFKQLELSVQNSNYCQPRIRFHLSCSRLGCSGRSHMTNLSKM